MKRIKSNFKENLRENKILVLSAIFFVMLIGFVAIPTLSSYKIANPTYAISVWDGTVASSYSDGDGTEGNPFIISNGSELLYLATQVETETDYEGKYFILSNDIVLNDGIFSYTKSGGIRYIKGDTESEIIPKSENDIINAFKSLNGFKGNFDGNYHTIYGLYIDDANGEQNALFTNLEGNVSNLYIKNAIIYGGKIVAGVAAKASNSNLTNISFDGYVIADEEVNNNTISKEINDIEKTVIDTENDVSDYISISDLSYVPGVITQITLSGVYEVYETETENLDAVLKINEEVINPGEFTIDLNNQLLLEIPVIYQTNIENTFKLTNLKYEIKYNYSNAAGIVSIAENTTLTNIINKADVYGSVLGSGIINTANGLVKLTNAYNNGRIESNYMSSGLISNINLNSEDVIITNCYNNSDLVSDSSAMIGNIVKNEGSVTLTNVFNMQDIYGINLIEETEVNINNSYVISDKKIKTGNIQGNFIETTTSNLKNKSYVIEELGFYEYDQEKVDEDRVWVWNYENDFAPILYIDDLNKPIVNIYINENVWDSYNKELEILKFPERLTVGIQQTNELSIIKEVYYYISDKRESLTKEELDAVTDWKIYDEVIQMNDEGFYVVYVKVIDDNDNEIYVNTDLMVIDLTGSEITISSSFTDNTWKSFNTEVLNYYINSATTVNILAEDKLSGINKVYYYVSDVVLTQEDVEKLDKWNEYTDEISITLGKNVIYAKVVDNCNYATYANSDLIVFNGYSLNKVLAGRHGKEEDLLNITDNSSVSLMFSYQDDLGYADSSRHQLVSNVLLPENTKITLIDKVKNKVYGYVTTNDDYGYDDYGEAVYDFTLFDEIGTSIKFQDNNYTGMIDENFVVVIDFYDAVIDKNLENVDVSLRINNDKVNQIRDTLVTTVKKFNVIKGNNNVEFKLSTGFDEIINYSENAKYTVDFTTKLLYKTINDKVIYDTSYEDKIIGLAIKLVDNQGKTLEKQYLKNISFMIGDKKYAPSSDGIVRINLEKGLSDITDNLIIQTYSDNYSLETGDYKFIISLYTAYDGVYSNENLASMEIPVYVGMNAYVNDNSFNVNMDNNDKIVTTNTNEFNFEILVSEPKDNNYIKMSLYKKKTLSAYDQSYTIVDLEEYLVDKSFDKADENSYYVTRNVVENKLVDVKIATSLLEKKGYMFVFELYDGDKLVNKINKKFIIK